MEYDTSPAPYTCSKFNRSYKYNSWSLWVYYYSYCCFTLYFWRIYYL